MLHLHMFPKWISKLNTEYLCVFSPNTEKHEPEKTPYLDTFHAVSFTTFSLNSFKILSCLRLILRYSIFHKWGFLHLELVFRKTDFWSLPWALDLLNSLLFRWNSCLLDRSSKQWQFTFYCVKDVRIWVFSDPYFPV